MTGAPWALAALLCWHLGVAGGLPKEVPAAQVVPWANGQRQIRVLMLDQAEALVVRSASAVAVENAGDGARLATLGGGAAAVLGRWQGQVALRAGSARLSGRALRIRTLSAAGGITVSARGGLPGRRRGSYPGALEITIAESGLRVVAQVDLEAYVAGVVAAELPRDFPLEAMEAQAIAARTYALYHLGDHATEGADLCAQVHCQAYAGVAPGDSTAAEATRRTAGQVLAWNGLLVDALYHSACGGATAAPWEVRQGKLLPYLTRSSDRDGYGEPPYCRLDRGLNWTRRFTLAQTERLVARNLGTVLGQPGLRPGRLNRLHIAGRQGGRVEWLEITASAGSYRVRGDAIRWLFGTGRPGAGGLPSTAFDLTVEKNLRGRPRAHHTAGGQAFVFRGTGHGHGIGLCQWGARGRAEAGQTAAEILAAYYPGAEVVNLRAT